MANYLIQGSTLTGIADAIRSKTSGSSPILTENMASAIMGISGGSSDAPFSQPYTQTKIVDNSTLAQTFTFSEDYHNYQMLKVVIYNSSQNVYETQFLLPEGIDKAFEYSSGKFCVNQHTPTYSNQYASYVIQGNNLTWKRNANRNVNIYEIYGITFSATLTLDVIYSRDEAVSNSTVTPTPPTGKTFWDYDAIMYMYCSTDNNVTSFAKFWITKPAFSLYGNEGYSVMLYKYNSQAMILFTPTSLGTFPYFYVVGLKFT